MDQDGRADRDDWSDLDLLTVGEAVRRLDAEIVELRERSAGLAEGAELSAARRRLDLLGRARTTAARHIAAQREELAR